MQALRASGSRRCPLSQRSISMCSSFASRSRCSLKRKSRTQQPRRSIRTGRSAIVRTPGTRAQREPPRLGGFDLVLRRPRRHDHYGTGDDWVLSFTAAGATDDNRERVCVRLTPRVVHELYIVQINRSDNSWMTAPRVEFALGGGQEISEEQTVLNALHDEGTQHYR